MDVKLCDAVVSIWPKIPEEYFQHLVKIIPRIKALQKAKVCLG